MNLPQCLLSTKFSLKTKLICHKLLKHIKTHTCIRNPKPRNPQERCNCVKFCGWWIAFGTTVLNSGTAILLPPAGASKQLESLEIALLYISRGNIPIFKKSSHTMFSSYSRPEFWYVTLIGISAQSGGNSWATANPLNAPPQLSIPYVVPKQLWTLNELKAALIRKFLHLSTEEGQGCQG